MEHSSKLRRKPHKAFYYVLCWCEFSQILTIGWPLNRCWKSEWSGNNSHLGRNLNFHPMQLTMIIPDKWGLRASTGVRIIAQVWLKEPNHFRSNRHTHKHTCPIFFSITLRFVGTAWSQNRYTPGQFNLWPPSPLVQPEDNGKLFFFFYFDFHNMNMYHKLRNYCLL